MKQSTLSFHITTNKKDGQIRVYLVDHTTWTYYGCVSFEAIHLAHRLARECANKQVGSLEENTAHGKCTVSRMVGPEGITQVTFQSEQTKTELFISDSSFDLLDHAVSKFERKEWELPDRNAFQIFPLLKKPTGSEVVTA